jgi:hypothetical protein
MYKMILLKHVKPLTDLEHVHAERVHMTVLKS